MTTAAASPIVVGVRVRPFNQREARFQSQCVVGMDPEGGVKLFQVHNGKVSAQAPRDFVYDHAFWTHDRESVCGAEVAAGSGVAGNASSGVVFADQAYVYEKMAAPVLENVLAGFNACLFAYGQTGSGKTYSMMGTPSDRGVLPRLGEAMFAAVRSMKETQQTLSAVEASFCEIYNEKVRDLMASDIDEGAAAPSLPIRQDPKRGIFVEGLTKYAVNNSDDFYVFLEKGLSSRAVASTNMNNTSSRSHAVVIIVVSQTGPKGERSGKLCLVDLAGSERVTATGATGQTAAEGQSINLSLTQLGICLKRLAEQAEVAAAGKKQTGSLPIPYRDSSLTYLLKENLGGNSKTAMLANISPASVNYDETLATLRFAAVARKVKSVATVNENPQTKLILQLREELAALRDKFQRLETSRRGADGCASSSTAPLPLQARVPFSSEPPIRSRTASPNAGDSEVAAALTKPAAPSPPRSPKRKLQRDTPDSIELDVSSRESSSADIKEHSGSELSGADDLDDEIRSLETMRHQTKSFVYHHHTHVAASSAQRAAAAPSFRFPGLQLNLSKLHAPVQHDTDLDDLMAEAGSNPVPLTRSSLPQQDAREINRSFTKTRNSSAALLRQQSSSAAFLDHRQATSTARDIFLDSQKPQLIHLNPDSAAHTDIPLVLVLEEGENCFDVAGANVFCIWDALSNLVTVFGSSAAIAVNGEDIEDEGCILRHRDRVVVHGVVAFRFSFAAGVVAQEGGFNKTATSIDHILQLEKYYRCTIQLERSRDAMAIVKALLFQQAMLLTSPLSPRSSDSPTSPRYPESRSPVDCDGPAPATARRSLQVTRLRGSLTAGGDDNEFALLPGATPRATPRNAHPVLASIGDDIAWFNECIYKIEVDLADQYPPPPEALVEPDDGSYMRAYEEAVNEVKSSHAEQLKELEWLRAQVSGAESRLEREMSVAVGSAASGHPDKKRSLSYMFFGNGSIAPFAAFQIEDVPFVDDPSSAAVSGAQSPTGGSHVGAASTPRREAGDQQQADVSPAPQPPTGTFLQAAAVSGEASSISKRLVSLAPEDVVFEQRVADAVVTRVVQLELAYHRKVRGLQAFSKTGPKNSMDQELWARLYLNPPFLGETTLRLEQSCYCSVKDNAAGTTWTSRFISASRTFVFVFKKADGRERSLTALYLPGATAVSLNSTDLEVCPSCPRHDRDTKSSNSKDAALLFRFRDASEKQLWVDWILQAANSIPMPTHMQKRMVEERAALFEPVTEDLYDGAAAAADIARSNNGAAPIVGAQHPQVVSLNQVCSTANWKPDEATKACEACSKAFSLFTRRHHCRVCGGIFCSDCLAKDPKAGGQLACIGCREEHLGSPRDSSNKKESLKELKKSYRQSTTVANTVDVTLPVVVRCTAIPQLEKLVEDYAVKIDGHLIRLRVDHYLGRIHTTLADDLQAVDRCARNPFKLSLRIKNPALHGSGAADIIAPIISSGVVDSSAPTTDTGAATIGALLSQPSMANMNPTIVKDLFFDSAYEREQCFESVMVLMQQRVFINTLVSARHISQFRYADVLVKDGSESSLICTTTDASTERTVWAGVESTDRPVPFHLKHDVYVVLGGSDGKLTDKLLEGWGLQVLTSVRLVNKKIHRTLTVVIRCALRNAVVGAPVVTPVVACGDLVAVVAVGFQLFETTLLFVASNHHEFSVTCTAAESDTRHVDPSAAPSNNGASPQAPPSLPFSLKDLAMPSPSLPIDIIHGYDHVFLVGAPPQDEFRRNTIADSSIVQTRSLASNVTTKRCGRTWAQLGVSCLNFHVSKLSATMEQRPLVMLTSAVYRSLSDAEAHVAPRDILDMCELWGHFGFDRFHAEANKPQRLFQAHSSDVHPPTSPQQLLRTMLLANALPEYFKTRMIHLCVPTIGSAVAFFAALSEGDTQLHLDMCCSGVAIGVVTATFRLAWFV